MDDMRTHALHNYIPEKEAAGACYSLVNGRSICETATTPELRGIDRAMFRLWVLRVLGIARIHKPNASRVRDR